MPNVRCSHSTKKISKTRAEYLSGADTHMGNKQGQVLYCKLFEDYIYEEQCDIKTHQELEIALPTELLEKNLSDNDWESIALKFQEIITDKMGYQNVSCAIHYRNSESGRTCNNNLHIHLGYIDRIVTEINSTDKYDTIGKIPYAINLGSGNVIKKRDFKNEKINHLKIQSGDVKLDFDKVDKKLLDEINILSKKRTPNETIIDRMLVLKEEIIRTATPDTRKFSFSNRLDKNTNHYQRMTNNKNNCCAVLNQICSEFDLTNTINKYGAYNVGNWVEDKKITLSNIDEDISHAKSEQKKIITDTESLKNDYTLALNTIESSVKKDEQLKKEKIIQDNISRLQKEEAIKLESYNQEIIQKNIQNQNALYQEKEKLLLKQKNIEIHEKEIFEKHIAYIEFSKKVIEPLQLLLKNKSNDLEQLVNSFIAFVTDIKTRESKIKKKECNLEFREDILFNKESWFQELGYLEACLNNDIDVTKDLEHNFDDLYSELLNLKLIEDEELDFVI